ncbi:SusD/RagB family nutrient-binding outer membrane lipoprotein [Chitinophaga pollutisoli]|uniref:SusD/RagB family nutrient-binding outer membrane lipoprotein n=1 Tax=Chitinophaga pollutisoli TaxID=3133966 RepID=A0ABZ2YT32_9BACT
MKRISYIVMSCLTLILAGSCTKDFDSINTDPTRGANIAPGQQLAAAAYYLTGGRETGYPNLYFFLPRAQYVTGSWGMRSGGKYIRNDFYNERMWEIFYGKSLKQLIDMLERSKNDADLTNYIAAGRILKAYIFSLMTDAYGDVPYSQAGVAYYEKIYTPKYDKQEDIYPDLIKELTEAAAQFDAGKQPLLNDIVFNGNVDRWKRLANSLRLRLGMRMSKVDAVAAAREVKAAVDAGVMTSADDNFKIIHENFGFPDLRGNGLSQAFHEESTFKYTIGTNNFVHYLKNQQDPRLSSFFINRDPDGEDITDLTGYISVTPGLYWWDNWGDFTAPNGRVIPHANKFCTINLPFTQLQASFLHMGFAEVQFLLAEAAARGWAGSNAQQFYHNGIRAAMKQLEMYPGMAAIPQAQVDAFVTAHPLPANDSTIKHINMQKWVALFPNGYEAFANQRRTGFPVLEAIEDVGTESETNKVPFRRLFYPGTEAFTNTVNYQDALQRIGGANDWLKPVWWDKQ